MRFFDLANLIGKDQHSAEHESVSILLTDSQIIRYKIVYPI
jgi:hypothetical protein